MIIQHPKESGHPFNTGKICKRVLSQCRLIQTEQLSVEQVNEINLDGTYLVYPDMTWLSTESTNPDELQQEQVRQLVFIDASWRHSKRILHLNALLQNLPRIGLPMNIDSEYRVRKSPKYPGLSTVESVYQVLSALEGEQNVRPLLKAFRAMVDLAISARGNNS